MVDYLFSLPILLFSVVVHEVAHGWVALRCGDPTARDAGRLTLNPLPHIDPFMTIVLPLLCVLSRTGFFIAGARPVPVNSFLLRGGERDEVKVSLAGPFANVLLALAGLAAATIVVFLFRNVASPTIAIVVRLLSELMVINLVLANFNLLPIPPLDGSWVLSYFLRGEWKGAYLRLQRHGFLVLMIFLFAVNAISGRLNVFDVLFYPSLKLMGVFQNWLWYVLS